MELATGSPVGGMIPAHLLAVFDEILKDIRSEFPGSHPVIGGGALRDAYHGKPIKDVDVFMRAQDHTTLDHVYTTKVPTPVIFTQGYQGRKDMHGAWDYMAKFDLYPVQLILADFETAQDLADTFDLGLSRITYDGHKVHYTFAFLQDSQEKVFRVRRFDSEMDLNRSQRRIERLRVKYPEFHSDPLNYLNEL